MVHAKNKIGSLREIPLIVVKLCHASIDQSSYRRCRKKQIRNQHVKVWLDVVKDAVLDAEDLLKTIDIEVYRCDLEVGSHSSPSKVWNFFNASFISFDKEIESKMLQVLEDLEYLAGKRESIPHHLNLKSDRRRKRSGAKKKED